MSVWLSIDCPGRRIGYARVSTKDQKLRMQREALKAVNCDLIFKDHGVSGAKSSRKGLDAMLAELRPGDSVVVFKLDRLGRSVLHLADLLVHFRDSGVHLVSLSEGIDTNTPGGKLVYHIFSAVAEFTRDLIIENTCAGMIAARRSGKSLGRPPKLTPDQVVDAHRMAHQDRHSLTEIASRLDVHPKTILRAFEREGLEAA